MKAKQVISGALAVWMTAMTIPAAYAAKSDYTDYATRGQVVEMLLSAADDYNPNVQEKDIIKGRKAGAVDLDKDALVTRAEAFVMLSRAFGTLSTPKGDNDRNGYPASNFTDIPFWAKLELENVWNAKITSGTSATTFSPNQKVSKREMQLLIQRVFALQGSNLRDDFYATINKAVLDSSTILPGYVGTGEFMDLGQQANEKIAGLIQEIVASGGKNAGEKNIAVFYNNILDQKARDQAGLQPIQKYLDEIRQSKNLSELMQVHNQIGNDLGSYMLLGFGLTIDNKNSSNHMVAFGLLTPSLGASGYMDTTSAQKQAYLQYVQTLFQLGGSNKADAAQQAQMVWSTEADIAANSLTVQESADIDKTYHVYSMQQLQNLFPNVDLGEVYKITGLQSTDRILVTDEKQLKACASLFQEKNLETLKTMMLFNLLASYGGCLNHEFTDAVNAFNQAYYGIEGTVSDADRAAQLVQSTLSDSLGEAYVSRYFSNKAKQDVEEMVQEMVAVYKERINQLDWMSQATKEKAIRKLDTMKIHIGYPDRWNSDLEGLALKSAEEGGSYFENVIAMSKAYRLSSKDAQNEPVDKDQWSLAPYTVNACYSSLSNTIEFPAAILQKPFYDVNASREENLGGIGYIIAHEITHAFDNNGAKYDENGNAANWWTEQDYEKFQSLCQRVVDFYDGQEIAPGIFCDGELTLSENIADLGAIACITQIEGQNKTPDYKTLYTSASKIWCSSYAREMRISLSQSDVHAPDKLRGGLIFANFDSFYQAFDIQPNDGMYVAPEDRVQIW